MQPGHGQEAYRVRMEWGPTGGKAVSTGADLAVVVDVLCFTTTLTVALERGVSVLPFRWRDERAQEYAAARDAVLAVGRLEARQSGAPDAVSLSPADMQSVTGVDRVVLPSPNGSAISFALAARGAQIVGACLRNRSAVARWLAPQVAAGATVAVVAAGERWPDGSLRPAAEDLWGAGAVLAALADAGAGDLSVEARLAERAFRSIGPRLAGELRDCAGGRELAAIGFGSDVDVAADLDASDVVPLLREDVFVAAARE